jgi:GNAT superfamily N-acetyltransferase
MIEIRQMTIDDLPLGLRLSRQAGWNQTESDWLRFMKLEPEGCFVAELNGCSIGTTTTCIFGPIAWIAMVLVDKNARGQGVGTKLLKHSLDYLHAGKVKTVRLDATAAGRPIYEKLGFVPEYELARFEGISRLSKTTQPVTEAVPIFYADMIAFDRQTTGTNRVKMLVRLFKEFPQNTRILSRDDKIDGFITMRPGANAIQIGPCIATMDTGPALLSDALNRCEGKAVFVDIPADNVHAVRIAESGGLKIQRRFTRMCRGERIKDDVKTIWAGSGPEKG